MTVYLIPGYSNYKEYKEGGSSLILKAVRMRDQKPFAIKMIKEEAAKNKEQMRAFYQEAEIMKEIRCRSIVRVYDFIEEAKPRPAAIMELFEGENLKVLLRTEPEFIKKHWHKILYEIAGALMYIHKRGIIHRDIKPENIMVAPDGMAKLIDFSLAYTKTKKPRKIQGTPTYISPEQIAKKKLTPATDIYSFGVTAYEMFAEKPPFSEPDLLEKHKHAIPESLIKLVPEMDKELAAFIMRMLAKDPQNRPQDMKEMLLLLKKISPDSLVAEQRKEEKSKETEAATDFDNKQDEDSAEKNIREIRRRQAQKTQAEKQLAKKQKIEVDNADSEIQELPDSQNVESFKKAESDSADEDEEYKNQLVAFSGPPPRDIDLEEDTQV